MVPYYIDINQFGEIISNRFITRGGNSNQFVKGDGSLDDLNYATESWVEGYSVTNYVKLSTEVFAGNGLSGGGSLDNDVTLNVLYGNTLNTAVEGNDYRVVDAFNKKVNSIEFSGENTKTLTITREDGTKLSASFIDKQGGPPIEEYLGWNLQTNGFQRKLIKSQDPFNIQQGTHLDVIYESGGTVKIDINQESKLELDKAHTHNNKSILDNITSDKVGEWDTAFEKYVTSINVTGGNEKLITLTSNDGSTLTTSFTTGLNDYSGWNLKTNDVQSKLIGDQESLNFRAGRNMEIVYLNGTLTFSTSADEGSEGQIGSTLPSHNTEGRLWRAKTISDYVNRGITFKKHPSNSSATLQISDTVFGWINEFYYLVEGIYVGGNLTNPGSYKGTYMNTDGIYIQKRPGNNLNYIQKGDKLKGYLNSSIYINGIYIGPNNPTEIELNNLENHSNYLEIN